MVYILLANGFEEIEALTPLDMLRRAKVDVKTVSITKERLVCGSHGIAVQADLLPDEATDKIDMLIFPGGMPGAANLDASDLVDALIKKAVKDGAHLAAICAAPLVLGRRGLLNGKRATCYPGFEGELQGAVLEHSDVITDGRVTTAVGMGAAVLFGAELVRLMCDVATAEQMLSAIQFHT